MMLRFFQVFKLKIRAIREQGKCQYLVPVHGTLYNGLDIVYAWRSMCSECIPGYYRQVALAKLYWRVCTSLAELHYDRALWYKSNTASMYIMYMHLWRVQQRMIMDYSTVPFDLLSFLSSKLCKEPHKSLIYQMQALKIWHERSKNETDFLPKTNLLMGNTGKKTRLRVKTSQLAAERKTEVPGREELCMAYEQQQGGIPCSWSLVNLGCGESAACRRLRYTCGV